MPVPRVSERNSLNDEFEADVAAAVVGHAAQAPFAGAELLRDGADIGFGAIDKELFDRLV